MKLSIEEHWYRSSLSWLTILLLPFSWLFASAVFLRKNFYHLKNKSLKQFSVPIIVVGNLTVGGTGKTPFVIALTEKLIAAGYQPGIVTRGVGGRRQQSPHAVTRESDPSEVGDEAVLLAKRTHCPVFVCLNRVAAVEALLKTHHCNVIISDDGLQHYRLKRTIEVAMIDADRGVGNGWLLPAGPLREPVSRLKKIDIIVNQQKLVGNTCFSVTGSHQKLLSAYHGTKVHAIAAIGHPKRFFNQLRQLGLEVVEHVFPDHYLFQKKDLAINDNLPILMTEKDAVKCRDIADERCWYVPVSAEIDSAHWEKILSVLTRE